MSRRIRTLRYKCSHEGCNEFQIYEFTTQRQLEESTPVRLYGYPPGKWLCTRHSDPEKLLSLTNMETKFECVSVQKDHGKYFDGMWGFKHGDGYKIFADDFPEGTKLIVTAKIELPKAMP